MMIIRPDGQPRGHRGQVLHRRVQGSGQTKVRNLRDGLLFVQQNVSGCQISVDYFVLLQKLHSLANLGGDGIDGVTTMREEET